MSSRSLTPKQQDKPLDDTATATLLFGGAGVLALGVGLAVITGVRARDTTEDVGEVDVTLATSQLPRRGSACLRAGETRWPPAIRRDHPQRTPQCCRGRVRLQRPTRLCASEFAIGERQLHGQAFAGAEARLVGAPVPRAIALLHVLELAALKFSHGPPL